tara:strand:- start:2514 stop:2726 length:213 start_codon:yes stop_codon:yes gene_type:complete
LQAKTLGHLVQQLDREPRHLPHIRALIHYEPLTGEISGASIGHLNHIASNKTFAEHVRTLVQLGEMELDD